MMPEVTSERPIFYLRLGPLRCDGQEGFTGPGDAAHLQGTQEWNDV